MVLRFVQVPAFRAAAQPYPGVDTPILAEGMNYLVQGAWYWDNLNPEDVHPGAMRKTALMLLNRVFPHHFSVND